MPPLLALPFPNIDPVLIQVGPFAIRWYALAYILGIFVGLWYAKRLAATDGYWSEGQVRPTRRQLDDFLIWGALGIIGGGRLGYVLFYNFPAYMDNPAAIFRVWEGGMSFHGGLLGLGLAMILFARSRQIPVWSLVDVITAAAPIGLFFGRLANFVNGELYGRVTDVPWGMVFPDGGPEPRHPSQLYEAALEGIVLYAVLRVLITHYQALKKPGIVSACFAIGYGSARILVEFFREPDAHIGFLSGGLTMGIVLSLPLVIAGLAVLIWAGRRSTA